MVIGGFGLGARMQRLVGEPPGKRLVAAVAGRQRILRLAAGIARRTFDADVEVIVVPPIRAHLVHPGLAFGGLAQSLLDRGVDEDAIDLGLLGRGLDDPGLGGRPMPPVDREPVLGHHVDRRHVLALLERERMVGHRGEPDVGVEADLMRGVAGQHRSAARLGNVADQNAVPYPFRLRLAREALEEGDHRRVPPHAVARQAHHLPGLAVDRQRLRAGEATAPVGADRAGLSLGRRHRPAEYFLGGQPRVGGIGERGQGLGVERPLVLRGSGRGASDGGKRQNQTEQYRSHGPDLWRALIARTQAARDERLTTMALLARRLQRAGAFTIL